jgi:hypothetical protein
VPPPVTRATSPRSEKGFFIVTSLRSSERRPADAAFRPRGRFAQIAKPKSCHWLHSRVARMNCGTPCVHHSALRRAEASSRKRAFRRIVHVIQIIFHSAVRPSLKYCVVETQQAGTARCAVRAAFSGATENATLSPSQKVSRPLHADGDAAARHPYHSKSAHNRFFLVSGRFHRRMMA